MILMPAGQESRRLSSGAAFSFSAQTPSEVSGVLARSLVLIFVLSVAQKSTCRPVFTVPDITASKFSKS